MRYVEPPARWVDPNGHLDWPPAGQALTRGVVTINGWVLFPTEPVGSVELRLGGHSLGRARLCLPRRDVSDLCGDPRAQASGFELTTNLADWQGAEGAARLTAVATSAGGERFEIPAVPVTIAEAPRAQVADSLPPAARTPEAGEGGGLRTLVCTHQLDLGGAQLYLVELLRDLIERGAINPTVVSAIDGPVREQLEDLGVPVHISSLVPVSDLSSHIGRVEELLVWAEGREFDLALINTSTALSLPGAEVAAELGIPAVWLIHESFQPAVLWSDFDLEIRHRAERVLAGAGAAIFEAEATRKIYEPLIGGARTHTIPYGLDLEPIEAERATAGDRAKTRRRVAIAEDADVMLCLGTVEPRKAQVPLAQAFDLIASRHPRAELLVVGSRDDDYARLFADMTEVLGSGDRVKLLPVTPDVHRWFGASDMLVCAADIESLPRTVLEAIAWEKPVLSTGVFGLPELISDGETGWLCEHNDIASLAAGLDRAFSAGAEERRRIAAAARDLLVAHDPDAYAERIAALLTEVADSFTPTV